MEPGTASTHRDDRAANWGETSTETHAAAAAAAAAQARLPRTYTAADSNQTQARISIFNSAGVSSSVRRGFNNEYEKRFDRSLTASPPFFLRHVNEWKANFHPSQRARRAKRIVSTAYRQMRRNKPPRQPNNDTVEKKDLQTSPCDRSNSKKSTQVIRDAPLCFNFGGRRRVAAASRQANGVNGDNVRSEENNKSFKILSSTPRLIYTSKNNTVF